MLTNAKGEDKKMNLNPSSGPKHGVQGGLWDEVTGWTETWGKVIGGKKREVIGGFCKSGQASWFFMATVQKMAKLVCSEGRGFGPLASKDHPSDTHAWPVE